MNCWAVPQCILQSSCDARGVGQKDNFSLHRFSATTYVSAPLNEHCQVPIRVVPKTGDTVEVVTEVGWRVVDQSARREVIAPRIVIHSLALRRWFGCWFRRRCGLRLSWYERGPLVSMYGDEIKHSK